MRPQLLLQTRKFLSMSQMFIGVNDFNIIAGPCSVENEEQMETVAQKLKQNNIKFMRGGAYKPRTSPHTFQGLGLEGLQLLKNVCEKYSLFSVSEILDPRVIEDSLQYIDIIQIGSRSMQNTTLLKEIGKTNHPVIIKRGMMSTLEEFLLAAEYVVAEGNNNVILCERGIRTFENSTRNTLDISSIAIIKKETSLPIIADLSHSLGRKDIIIPIARAVIALGVDGIMLEVHNHPPVALSDKEQQLKLERFQTLLHNIG